MYNKKMLIALAAVFGLSSTIASLAVADYDYGKLYGYEKPAKTASSARRSDMHQCDNHVSSTPCSRL